MIFSREKIVDRFERITLTLFTRNGRKPSGRMCRVRLSEP